MATDEAQLIYMDCTSGNMLPFHVRHRKGCGAIWSRRRAITANPSIALSEGAIYYGGGGNAINGLADWSGGRENPEIFFTAQNAADRKDARSRFIGEEYAYWTVEKWNLLLKSAGLHLTDEDLGQGEERMRKQVYQRGAVRPALVWRGRLRKRRMRRGEGGGLVLYGGASASCGIRTMRSCIRNRAGRLDILACRNEEEGGQLDSDARKGGKQLYAGCFRSAKSAAGDTLEAECFSVLSSEIPQRDGGVGGVFRGLGVVSRRAAAHGERRWNTAKIRSGKEKIKASR